MHNGLRTLLTLVALAAPALAQALAGAAPARSAPAARPAEPTIKLRVAHVYDENYPWQKAHERFREIVRTRTRGTVDVQIFPNATLGTEKDYVSYLRQGVLDIATVSTAAAGDLVPEVAFFDLMYLFRDHEDWKRAVDGRLGHHMSDVIRRSTSKGGIPGFEVLGYWSGSPINVVSRTRGYQTLKDLEGLKIRNQGVGVQIDQWKALGAAPVTVPYEGIYSAFKDGVLDATPGITSAVYAMKFHEVAPHISETEHTFGLRLTLMSGHTWQKLTPEQRDAVTEASRDATTIARTLEAQQIEELTERMKTRHNVKFYAFREKELLREKTQAIRQQFADRHGLREQLATIDAEWDKKPR